MHPQRRRRALDYRIGDLVIVATFGAYDERDLETYAPVVVHVDDRNAIAGVDSHPEVLLGSPLASEAGAS